MTKQSRSTFIREWGLRRPWACIETFIFLHEPLLSNNNSNRFMMSAVSLIAACFEMGILYRHFNGTFFFFCCEDQMNDTFVVLFDFRQN